MQPEVARRCVRLADYTIDGQRVFEAISSRGERVAQVPVPFDALDEVVREWLWGFLEGIDPRPALLRSA